MSSRLCGVSSQLCGGGLLDFVVSPALWHWALVLKLDNSLFPIPVVILDHPGVILDHTEVLLNVKIEFT